MYNVLKNHNTDKKPLKLSGFLLTISKNQIISMVYVILYHKE
jgi:hypothetical protein